MEKAIGEGVQFPSIPRYPPSTAGRLTWNASMPPLAICLLAAFSWWIFQSLPTLFQSMSLSTNGPNQIAWSPCADISEFECAFLRVPMDYTDPLPNETVSLALRRLPATAPVAERLGTLFVNPGGPGGSGTEYIAETGMDLSIILSGRYDILSWDPRGVNMTTPPMGCFPTDYDERMQEYKLHQNGLPFEMRATVGTDLPWFQRADRYYQALVESCARNGHQKMLKSLSTASSARDMVEILKALGEEERGLQYWGFSYGTILGATFAVMFPELVHRMVLDGVSHAAHYHENLFEWGRSAMDDSQKVWNGFVTMCAEAGHEGCAMARKGATVDDVRDRIEELLESLLINPLSVPYTESARTSGIVTASDLRFMIFLSLYKPGRWRQLAQWMVDAERGDGSAFILAPLLTDRRDMRDNIFHRYAARVGGPLTTVAIQCGDTDLSVLHANLSAEAMSEYSRELFRMSITGESWHIWVARCRIWNVTAIDVYRGPWSVEDGLRKTKFPILFVGNTADPVTPLSTAEDMVKRFGNASASLLIQDGYGHCSLAHPSLCTARKIASYFFDGDIPKHGTTCKSDSGFIFVTHEEAAERMDGLNEEDEDAVKALERLSESMIW
ncbi:alpha/beta-hydrolase [Calocera viscosa TUFC12733]|uniref:Alpha/beta-hydrolase n=1 Tax=Calocera viscosa (strain TUFC12733) TaxID=1330018 RepID=A0A167LU98_CALVF|nr:alpha/beta-hydrolase [Calocera viscosa TUFC12733]